MTVPGYMKASALTQLAGYPAAQYPKMRAATATAFMYERLHREGVRTGHTVSIAQPGGAVRMYADLVDIQRQWLGKSHNTNWFLNPGSGAMPSLTSVHGLGRCLDFTGSVAWIKQVSDDYGITYPLVYLGDTNHGQHDGKTRGQKAPYPYEIKRLQQYLGVKVTSKNDAATKKALAARVTKDKRQGLALRTQWSHYLDLEAKAKAA